MIGFLSGVLAGRTADGCFMDVNGVGYRLSCSATTLRTLPAEGGRFKLWTYLNVREDALTLFGFSTENEQRTFEALLSVAGVGPKVALAVCSALAPDALRRALVTDDTAAIAAVPGIGKKTAQRIVLELKEKLALPDLEIADAGNDSLRLARSALENLGYSPSEVRSALAEVAPAPESPVEDVVKHALKVLA
ncbi:MAG: Holliday junction branch migration protein RuvA [Actinomycetota bacterium]|nr:Holliday junction branch migration protein RuvA [Actinomycetota bacterium]